MNMKDEFSKKLNMVEHTMSFYAWGYATLPALGIYDNNFLKTIEHVTGLSHIYMIGVQPRIEPLRAFEEENFFCIELKIHNKKRTDIIKFQIPEDFVFMANDGDSYLLDKAGTKFSPSTEEIIAAIASQIEPIPFHVKYIGQAYGKDGKRNVIDRLKKHETLQKIALRENKANSTLQIIVFELAQNNLITSFNPFAANTDENIYKKRIRMGLDKLENTSEAERVSLYEAALIRYFEPEYNHHFKNSFPSTNMKVLKDCYNKDFQGLVAEICIDNFWYSLYSDKINPTGYNHHIAQYDLHTEDARKSFFSTTG
jgi:hypothetical protein